MKNKWKTPQSLIIFAIILVLFSYITIDAFFSKPKIKDELQEVKKEYIELSNYLDEKIPEIDSTFRLHATQINEQKGQITDLQKTFGLK